MVNVLLLAGPRSEWSLADASTGWSSRSPAGFWAGLWHGLIVPIAFLVSLFSTGVRIYETNNRGLWYDFGFYFGASASLGGGGAAAT